MNHLNRGLRYCLCSRYMRGRASRQRQYIVYILLCLFCLTIAWQMFFATSLTNTGLGDWSIQRSAIDQACVHPKMPLDNPQIIQAFKKLPPIQCKSEEDWLYVAGGRVYISQNAIAPNGRITCQITPIFKSDDDDVVARGKPYTLVDGSLLTHDSFVAECEAENGKTYANVHNSIKRQDEIVSKIKNSFDSKGSDKLNVVILGIDSVSNLMYQRHLPRSHDYFTKTLGGIVLEGYNIVGDGTPQALIPILTGQTETELPNVKKGEAGSDFVDVYPFIWKEFERHGYVTHFAEDQPSRGAFSFRLNGFHEQPTHHYMRPYYLEVDRYLPLYYPLERRPAKFCVGSKPMPTLMLDWAKSSYEAYKEVPKFFMLFNSEVPHLDPNNAQLLEEYMLEFLKYMNDRNHLNNTILIIMSDHGPRFYTQRATEQGKLEERMPYFGFRFPDWFGNSYPDQFQNFVANSKRLTTPFDIHETLMDLVNDFSPPPIPRKTHGISLFKRIPLDRTCESANIEPHWCACLSWKNASVGDSNVEAAVLTVIHTINNLLQPFSSDCVPLSLSAITKAFTFSTSEAVLRFLRSKDSDGRIPDMSDSMKSYDILYLVTFYTKPNSGFYEATVRKRASDGQFLADIRQISRINKYGNTSWCIADRAPRLSPYCVCKIPFTGSPSN